MYKALDSKPLAPAKRPVRRPVRPVEERPASEPAAMASGGSVIARAAQRAAMPLQSTVAPSMRPANGERPVPPGTRRPRVEKPVRRMRQIIVEEPEPLSRAELMRFDPGRTFGWLRRGLLWIIAFAVLGALAGIGFVSVVKPRYTVGVDVLVDPANLNVVSDNLFSDSQQRDVQLLDAESKLAVLTSGNVLARVVKDLKLDEDPEFIGEASSGGGLGAVFGGDAPKKEDPALAAMRALEKRVHAVRAERSFIVSVTVWTEDAQKSVAVANDLVTAFQEELVSGETASAKRTAAALFDRLDGLKTDVARAEEAVEAFKRDHGLISSAGQLVSTLVSDQMNSKVVEARSRVVLAESRYKELTNAANGQGGAGALQSETMTALRSQYAVLKQQVDAQAAVLGPLHPALLALKPQLKAIETQIAAETARMVQAAKTEMSEAKAALASIGIEADSQKGSVFNDNESQVQLRELERDATAKASIYELFLSRARQVTEQQQLDTTNVRVISPAVPPPSRSYPPRTALVMAAGAFAGLLLGAALAFGLGFLREWRRSEAV